MKVSNPLRLKNLLVLLMLIAGVFVIFPLVLVLINSVKSYQEIAAALLALPAEFHFENFPLAFVKMNYAKAITNSLIVTGLSVSGLVLIASMTSYQIVRRNCIASRVIFILILSSMAVPFQALMVPSVIIAKTLGLTNQLFGVVIMYWGFLLPMAVFLYQGFIRGVPHELEEAARIDGCGQTRTFFRIVFPLLKPISATVAIINVLAVFNDFTIPLIMLSSKDNKTIPLALSVFYGNYINEWNLILSLIHI